MIDPRINLNKVGLFIGVLLLLTAGGCQAMRVKLPSSDSLLKQPGAASAHEAPKGRKGRSDWTPVEFALGDMGLDYDLKVKPSRLGKSWGLRFNLVPYESETRTTQTTDFDLGALSLAPESFFLGADLVSDRLMGAGVRQGRLTEQLGSHQVIIRPFDPERHSAVVHEALHEGGAHVMEAGSLRVAIRDGELVVGGLFYGKLHDGDMVLIEHGQVRVAGRRREGSSLAPREMARFYPVERTVVAMSRRRVEVLPGSPDVTRSPESGLCVGSRCVQVKGGKLLVDGVPYGPVRRWARVEVLFGEVRVDGQLRQPIMPEEDPAGTQTGG